MDDQRLSGLISSSDKEPVTLANDLNYFFLIVKNYLNSHNDISMILSGWALLNA